VLGGQILVLPVGNTFLYVDPICARARGTPADARIQRIREYLRPYRELAAQSRWSETAKELEAIEAEAR
jgi:hypothetical protein